MATLESSIRAEVTSGVAGQVWIETLIGLGVGCGGRSFAERNPDNPAYAWRVAWRSFWACFWPVLRQARNQRRCWIDLGCGLRAASVDAGPCRDFAYVEGKRAFHGNVERCPSAVSGACSLFALPGDARGRWPGHSGRTSLKRRGSHRSVWVAPSLPVGLLAPLGA